MSTRSLDQRSDRGFTMPEVLISIVIIAIIATVMVGVFAVFMRNTPTTEARAQDARSVMGLVTWLPQDVDSTPPTGFDVDGSTPSGCNESPGVNLLRMEWSEKIGSTTTRFIANYRHVSQVDEARVVRVTCSGVGGPPFASGFVQNLTSELPLLPASWTPGDAPAAVSIIRTIPADPTSPVELVTLELTTFSGDIVRTDSAAKNPAETLPTTTLPSWIPPTPSTIPSVNSLPETTDLMFDAFPGPTTTTVNLIVSDADGDPLVVTLDSVPSGWVVTLVGLEMVITPDPADLGDTKTIEYTVDDLQGDGVVEGEVVVTVVTSPATTTTTTPATTTTTTTTLPPPCAVTSASLTPNSIKNVNADGRGGSVNVGVLFKNVTVTAATNGYCSGVQIQYVSGGVNTPGFLNLSKVGPTSWSGELLGRGDGSSETWSDGPHQISFHDASGGPYLSRTLTIE